MARLRFDWLLLFPLICLALMSPRAMGQAAPFRIQAQQAGGTPLLISSGQTLIVLSTGVGTKVSLTLSFTFTGTTQANISSDVQAAGSADFAVGSIAPLPVALQPNASFSIPVTFTPSSPAGSTELITIPFTISAASSTQPATAGVITLTLAGQTSNFAVSYGLSTNGNTQPLANGDTLNFGSVPVNTTIATTVFIQNTGSGAGTLTSIALSGTSFRATSVPLTPLTIPAGQSVSFQIQYSPLQLQTDAGALTLSFGGTTFSTPLQGTAVASYFGYSLLSGANSTPLNPGQTSALADTQLGQAATYTLQVQNTSNQLVTVSLISLSGVGFSLVDAPLLPLQVSPGGGFSVLFSVTPAQAGPLTGRLRVGQDSFTFTLNGLGPNLVLSYQAASSSVTVPTGGTVLFNPTAVGRSSALQVTLQNTGTTAATISSIGLNGPTGVFQAQGLPPFPFSINAGAQLAFQLAFAPLTTGQATGTLLINSQQFSLSGFGNSPPQIPSYSLNGPAKVTAFQQATLTLSLPSPYPLPLKGVLTLQVGADSFGPDPEVQFSTGGQSTTFTIPANRTDAIFANGSTQIRVQLGTVAGKITIIPTFATEPGGVDVTPAVAPPLVLTIPAQVPTLITARLTSTSTTGFTVAATGFTTSRALSSLGIQITGVAGSGLATQNLTLQVDQLASLWFSSAAAQPVGGQFTVSIPFTVSGPDLASVAQTINSIHSVAITATDASGTSNAASVILH